MLHQKSYITSIQSKEAYIESPFPLILLKEERSGWKNLPVLENITIAESYGNEDASWKNKKDTLKRKNLKRKYPKEKISIRPIVADTLSGQEDDVAMEYCNAPSSCIPNVNRDHHHTLYHPNNGYLLTCKGSSDVQRDTEAAEVTSSVTCDNQGSTNMIIIPTFNTRRVGLSGNGNNSDDDFVPKKEPAGSVPKVKYCGTEHEKQLRIFNDIILKQGIFIYGDHKNLKDNLEHAYNECPIIKGTQMHCTTNSTHCKEAKEYFDNIFQKLSLDRADLNTKTNSTITNILFSHSWKCHRQHCDIPLCQELVECLREEIRQCSDDADYSFVGSDAPVLLYSTTSALQSEDENTDSHSKIQLDHLRFNFQYPIGKGGFGKVYKAWVCASKSEAYMAVKKMKFNEQQENPDINDLIRHIKDIGKSPYLLTPDIVVSSTDRKLTYIVMELAEIALSDYLKKLYDIHKSSFDKNLGSCNSGLPPAACALFFKQILSGVEHLHVRGFVHADIKSDNIMIMPEYRQVKIIDFDMLKKEATKKQCGTPGYIAPEILCNGTGNCIKPSDIFAASIVLAEMYFGGLDMRYGKIHSKKEYNKFVKERNQDLYKYLCNQGSQLAEIFWKGTIENPVERATCKDLLLLTDMVIKNLSDQNFTLPSLPNDRTENGLLGDLSIQKKLAKKAVRNWLEQEMQKLPRQLPVAKPYGRYGNEPPILHDSRWLSENRAGGVFHDNDIAMDNILN